MMRTVRARGGWAHPVLWLGVLGSAAGCYQPGSLGPRSAHAAWRNAVEAETSWLDGEDAALTPSGVLQLTAERAATLAVARHTDRDAWLAAIRIEEAEVDRATDLQPVEVRFGASRLTSTERGRDPTVDVALRVRWDRPGMRDARADEEVQETRMLEAEHGEAELALAAAAMRAHLTVAMADRKLAMLAGDLERSRAKLGFLQERLEAGAATDLDLAVARLEVAEAAEARVAVATERVEASRVLARRIGLGPDVELRCRPWPKPPAKPITRLDRDRLIEEALLRRPAAAGATATLARAEARLYQAQAERWPWFSFAQVGYEMGTGGVSDGLEVSGGIDVPVFGLNRGGVAAAEAEASAARADGRAQVIGVGREVRDAVLALRQALMTLSALDQDVQPGLDAGAAALERAEAAGTLDPLRASALGRRRLRLQLSRLTAERAYHEAWIELKRVTGRALAEE